MVAAFYNVHFSDCPENPSMDDIYWSWQLIKKKRTTKNKPMESIRSDVSKHTRLLTNSWLPSMMIVICEFVYRLNQIKAAPISVLQSSVSLLFFLVARKTWVCIIMQFLHSAWKVETIIFLFGGNRGMIFAIWQQWKSVNRRLFILVFAPLQTAESYL